MRDPSAAGRVARYDIVDERGVFVGYCSVSVVVDVVCNVDDDSEVKDEALKMDVENKLQEGRRTNRPFQLFSKVRHTALISSSRRFLFGEFLASRQRLRPIRNWLVSDSECSKTSKFVGWGRSACK